MSKSIQKYQELTVWQKGMQLVKMIYLATKALPREELYGLTNQLCRAAISIPSNIAEGFGRYNTKDYVHFCALPAVHATKLKLNCKYAYYSII